MANKILRLNAETVQFEEIEVKGKKVSYEELRDAIGGYIEHITFNLELERAGIDVWVDEEGKLKNLTASTIVYDSKASDVIDVCAGPLVFTKKTGDGESYCLTEQQIEIIKNELKQIATFGNNILGIKKVRILPYR